MNSVTSELRRAVEILSMPIARLNETLREELARNAALEVAGDQDAVSANATDVDATAADESGAWSVEVTKVRPQVRVRPGLPADDPDARSASWFCRSIDQRERMIARVLGAILRPGAQLGGTKVSATLLANELELHEATLMRIVAGKTVGWRKECIAIVDLIDFDSVERLDEQPSAAPAPLADDRLDRAFAELEQNGIVALQNAGSTQTQGWEAADLSAGNRAVLARGAVFYHQQDLERVRRGGDLLLAFGAYGDDPGDSDEASIAIGREVCATLARYGIATSWDGTPRTRIRATLSPAATR